MIHELYLSKVGYPCSLCRLCTLQEVCHRTDFSESDVSQISEMPQGKLLTLLVCSRVTEKRFLLPLFPIGHI